jgi:hypothetical protein
MIVVRLAGGLGNQMFQYAFGRSLAHHLNSPLKLDLSFLADRSPVETHVLRDFSLDAFDLNVKAANFNKNDASVYYYLSNPSVTAWKIRRKISGCTVYREQKDSWFDPEVFNLNGNLYFEGNWQSPKYFESIASIIREDFSFKRKISDDLRDIADEIHNSESICLHVRRGDYVWQPYANKFNGVKGVDYFDSAISFILQTVINGKIYVFSDDIEWCVENIRFDLPVCFIEREYPNREHHEYFRLMSLCKHFAISNSTFSWWAAWLSQNFNKIVVAPKKWFEDSSIDTSDMIPDSWIEI